MIMHPAAKLVVSSGSKQGQEIDLQHDVTTLGRAASCQVQVEESFASRRHAQIVRRDEVYWLRDLGSKNGTLLNSQIVKTEMRLTDGAEIRIGEAVFRFYGFAATRTHPAVGLAPAPSLQPFPLRISEAAREVWLHGEKLEPPLSPKQFDLLRYLWQHQG